MAVRTASLFYHNVGLPRGVHWWRQTWCDEETSDIHSAVCIASAGFKLQHFSLPYDCARGCHCARASRKRGSFCSGRATLLPSSLVSARYRRSFAETPGVLPGILISTLRVLAKPRETAGPLCMHAFPQVSAWQVKEVYSSMDVAVHVAKTSRRRPRAVRRSLRTLH